MTAGIAAALFAATLAGCSSIPSPTLRTEQANARTLAAGWSPLHIPAGAFTLVAFLSPQEHSSNVLTIYIEGDGAAWLDVSTPSDNPTPVRPVGLMLALSHQDGPAAYLARPCQYVSDDEARGCSVSEWTGARFSSDVILAENRAVDVLKERYRVSRIVLVGYSGGGAVAALVTAERDDIDRLVTIAGNLDHKMWTRAHGLTPLNGSLNPADYWSKLVDVPQIHFVGGPDTVVDGKIAAAFVGHFPTHSPNVVTMPNFDHQNGWVESWPELQKQAFGPLKSNQ
ncbi:MAG: alpha/beta hydrolase [Propionivibrio sp.]